MGISFQRERTIISLVIIMRKKLCYYLLFLVFLLNFSSLAAQRINLTGFDELFPQQARYVPVLDSSINVTKLTKGQRNKLIERLFNVDQMYRISLNKVGSGSEEFNHFVMMISINDPINQAILLKILKIDGWPCDCEKGPASLSVKAWFIPWHTRGNYNELIKFYPFLLKANKAECIDKNQFRQIDRQIKHLYAIGYR